MCIRDRLDSGNLDGFCIVSSDSDVTRLAARLREAGKLVIGMGESKTLGPFVKACDQFKYLDLILDHSDHNEPDTAGARDVTDAAEAAAMAAAGDDTAINRDSVYKLCLLYTSWKRAAPPWQRIWPVCPVRCLH